MSKATRSTTGTRSPSSSTVTAGEAGGPTAFPVGISGSTVGTLSDEPLAWAIAQLEADSRVAAVSLQGQSPERLATTIDGIEVRQKKALQALAFVRALATLLGELELTASPPEIVPAPRLAAAARVLREITPAADRRAAERVIEEKLMRIRERLL